MAATGPSAEYAAFSLQSRLKRAFHVAAADLLAEREPGGWWVGELSTSALSTATAVSALSVCRSAWSETSDSGKNGTSIPFDQLIDDGIAWLVGAQNEDGGWGDTQKSYSNISTTMLAAAAFHLAGRDEEFADRIARADAYVKRQGGVAGLRERYGKDRTFSIPILTNCAIAGRISWREVSALPFEAAWVPQRFYRWMQLPVVSYAVPALVAIGQAKFIHDPPRNPLQSALRKMAIAPTLRVLERMQPASGGYLEAIPLTSFVVMGLASSGRVDHAVVNNGLRFIYESVRSDGSWPIDTNLATWNTTLSVNALAACQQGAKQEDSADDPIEEYTNALRGPQLEPWLLACQYKERHPFTGAAPGGWGWSDLSGSVPDADDTPGALLALAELNRIHPGSPADQDVRHEAAENGIRWLLDLQNRDGGWPTFCRGWGKLPFDRSGADLTAHVLRALVAWKDLIDRSPRLRTRAQNATQRGWLYLSNQQRSDGSWIPLWFGNQDEPDETNPVYGTAKVVLAYRDAGKLETEAAQRGLSWLASHQNSDGGWGGGDSVSASSEGWSSTVEETALAVDALLGGVADSDQDGQSIAARERQTVLRQGLTWLVEAVDRHAHTEQSPIGFYFAKLWYHERLYPLVFTVSALGNAVRRARDNSLLPVLADPTHERD